jgi:hypothetical protein
MKFIYYLDAVVFCRHNNISVATIQRLGTGWRSCWLVPIDQPLPKGAA